MTRSAAVWSALLVLTACSGAERRDASATPPVTATPGVTLAALVPELPPEHVEAQVVTTLGAGRGEALAVVHVPPGEVHDAAVARERTLVIGRESASGGVEAQSTTCVALCPDCGGIMGDPFMGMETSPDGTLLVHNAGGSRWRWAVSYTVAWHEGAFRITGVRRAVYDSLRPVPPAEATLDLVTGQLKTTGEDPPTIAIIPPPRVEDCEAVGRL